MVLSQSEATAAVERAERSDRIATAFEQRGEGAAAGRFRNRSARARAPADARMAMLNVAPGFLSSDQIRGIDTGYDRELLVAQLRAQARAAAEAAARERSQKELSKSDKRDIDRYQKIEVESSRLADSLSMGSGLLPEGLALTVGRASKPDLSMTELRRKFGNPAQRSRAIEAQRNAAIAENAGFDSVGDMLDAQRAGLSEDAVEQRLRFLASGESKTATPAQAAAARVELERRGVKVFSQLSVNGQAFERGGGSAEGPGQLIATRNVTMAEQRDRAAQSRAAQGRLSAGIQRDTRGNILLVRDGGKSGLTAGELFADLGAPESKVLGSIEFGREPRTVVKGAGLFPELSFARDGPEEVSRKSVISETIYEIPSVAAARFAGFPTEQAGAPIEFPARFKVVSEDRQDFPRRSVFSLIDEGGRGLAVSGRIPLPGEAGRDEFLKKPAGERLKLSVKDFGGRAVANVQKTGKALEGVGGSLERAGAATLERFPLVTAEERAAARAKVRGRDRLSAGAGLLAREVPSRLGITAKGAGQFLTEEGRIAQESPVTFGTGEAVLIGAGFGGVSKTIQIVRGSRLAQRASLAGRATRVLGGTARAAEVVAGVGLGGAFVVQKVQAVRSSPRPGATLATATNELAGFSAGFRVGSLAISGVAGGVKRVDSLLFETTINERTGEVFKVASPGLLRVTEPVGRLVQAPFDAAAGMGRRGEVGGRSAKERAKRARPIDAGFRAAQSARQRQAKFVVSEGPLGVTRELRGQARARTEELRVLSQTTAMREAYNLEFASKSGSQIFVKRRVPTGVVAADLAFPGMASPRIEPVPGRVRAAQRSQIPKALKPGRKGSGLVPAQPGRKASGASGGSSGSGSLLVVEQAPVVKGRGQLVTSEPPKSKGRKQSGEVGGVFFGRLSYVEPPAELSAPAGFQAQRRESEFFARGSQEARRLGALERLRALQTVRVAQVKEQLPVVAGGRGVTVFQPERGGTLAGDSVRARIDQARGQSVFPGVRERVGLSFDASSKSMSDILNGQASGSRLRVSPLSDVASVSAYRFDSATLLDGVSASDTVVDTALDAQSVLGGGGSSGGGSRGRRVREPLRVVPGGLSPGRGRLPVSPLLEVPEKPVLRFGAAFSLDRDGGAPGFQVLVRRQGKFELASNRVLTRSQAIALGAGIADASPAQTFKLLEVSAAAEDTRDEPSRGRVDSLLRKFSTSRGGLFRERQANLIDTPGELRDITLKGVQASAQSRQQLRRLGL